MGFLSKMKAIKNAITGGAAKVYLDAPEIDFGAPFELVVRVEVDDADVKVDRVYLELEGIEEVEIPDTDVIYDRDGVEERRREIVRASTTTTRLNLTLDEAQVLVANEKYDWTCTIELPESALAPYFGKHCQHFYRARASLDCFGNDPDSGWVALNML